MRGKRGGRTRTAQAALSALTLTHSLSALVACASPAAPHVCPPTCSLKARPNHIANAWTKSIPGICLILRLAYPCRSTSRSSKPRWPPRASLRP